MAKVKICGITNLEDALYAVKQGADALGFVFYKKSPRYIQPEKAKVIIRQLPKFVKKVGVFVNTKEITIRRIAHSLKLDMLQFHGYESEDFCRRFRDFKVIKAFRVNPSLSTMKRVYLAGKGGVKKTISLAYLSKYNVWAYLFDTFAKNKFGGTGKSYDWWFLNCLRGLRKTIFLSGGLDAQNVKRALKSFSARWVDASSSLEKYAGKKDHIKIKRFIKNAKGPQY